MNVEQYNISPNKLMYQFYKLKLYKYVCLQVVFACGKDR